MKTLMRAHSMQRAGGKALCNTKAHTYTATSRQATV